MMDNPADLISQKEKREVLANDRMARNTYLAHANDAELEMGGRFTKLTPTSVTGASAGSAYPQQPEGSPWHHDPVPDEMPLGYSVDEQEAVGERHEVEASSTGTVEEDGPAVAQEPSHVITAVAAGPISKGFRRRV